MLLLVVVLLLPVVVSDGHLLRVASRVRKYLKREVLHYTNAIIDRGKEAEVSLEKLEMDV